MWALIHAATVTYYIDRLRPLFSLSDSAPLRSSTSYTENHSLSPPLPAGDYPMPATLVIHNQTGSEVHSDVVSLARSVPWPP